jgi:glycosyltransferase involved in cell wall biosynthesis
VTHQLGRSRRVAVFAPHFAEYATRFAIALAAHGAEVLLILDARNCTSELTTSLRSEAEDAVDLLLFDGTGAWKHKAAIFQILTRIALFRPDIVHVQEQADMLTASVTRRLRRQKIVLTVHDPKPHSGEDNHYASTVETQRRELRAHADAFHVHGDYCRDSMLAAGWSDKPIVSTLHGVILAPRKEELAESEPGRILMFGRMEAYKGVDLLLEAAETLRARRVHFRLVLAGRGPELDRARAEARQHDDIDVIDKFLTPSEAVGEFQRAAFVVAPYRDATQSGVIAAALANGRPVVASRVGGLVDVIVDGRNGLLITPGNAVELADSLEQLVTNDDLRNRLAAGALDTAVGELAWMRIGAALLQTYATLCAQITPPSPV